MEEIHRGIKIKYSTYSEKFVAEFGGIRDGTYENESLEKVRKYIDNVLKKKFDPIPALRRRTHWGGSLYQNKPSPVEKITITSITQDGEFWIKNSRGRREKENATLFKYTKANANKIKTIMNLIKKRDEIDDQIIRKWENLDEIDKRSLVKKYTTFEED